jgi:hypothetical protein
MIVPVDLQACPSEIEEVASAYCLDRLPPADAEAFGLHIVDCRRCALVVARAAETNRALRTARDRFDAKEPA